ncbi:1-deoxy-D-xylulose-5-phosphate reductoisomerase [Hyphobacterium sp. HN65]|uniref:1-deoxy-D-xylulose 5-phosphate reductoisomerase n=1 Tax=Hyphobacterium lacteum TaxID=3116575 RepID=A0ABU7LLX9_9PROT|nr:1-deoxy-D-xylulose-5-phosphate reductoisomerase [Hyphobacterium sp. HN65]MEE2524897.1 1-deoxy-D-xylulose-5-phosphate reductoisomerase [Hyphobacterium sp. HN65]
MSRRISILGATGSVGTATLDLVGRAPEGEFEIVALTAHSNVKALAELAEKFRPEIAVIADNAKADELADALKGSGIETAAGPVALVEAASRPVDWTMAAIVGSAGLEPSAAALQAGSSLALANKECLVCAGEYFIDLARQRDALILPVDSEHNAIFQSIYPGQDKFIRKITLTASGGPFRDWPVEKMKSVTREDALAHPVWSMGDKISIDSATLMNKGLEVIEACRLFSLPPEQVDVVVHRQSVIHGLVEYIDGSVLAQLGSPDMRIPIASALSWPERIDTPAERLDLARIGQLDFEAPDKQRFPALRIAREALLAGEGATSALNAANEVAVAAFLERRIGFLDIPRLVSDCLEQLDADHALPQRFNGLEEALRVDRLARDRVRGQLASVSA